MVVRVFSFPGNAVTVIVVCCLGYFAPLHASAAVELVPGAYIWRHFHQDHLKLGVERYFQPGGRPPETYLASGRSTSLAMYVHTKQLTSCPHCHQLSISDNLGTVVKTSIKRSTRQCQYTRVTDRLENCAVALTFLPPTAIYK